MSLKIKICSEDIKVEPNNQQAVKFKKFNSRLASQYYQSRPMTTKNIIKKRKMFIHSK